MNFEAKQRDISIRNGSKYQKSENDFYITPKIAIEDIIKKELIHMDKNISILDAGCGNGIITETLKEYGFKNIYTLDLIKRDYPLDYYGDINNFHLDKQFDVVISNPPYGRGIINKFVKKCLDFSKNKTIIFSRWQLLETHNRYNLLFDKNGFKLCWIYLYSNRVACVNPNNLQASKSMMNYAWFVWENGYNDIPKLNWIDKV